MVLQKKKQYISLTNGQFMWDHLKINKAAFKILNQHTSKLESS
jgi:hypothetical protein